MSPIRIRFSAAWLPDEQNRFWSIVEPSSNLETFSDLFQFFNEQQKKLAEFSQISLSKRTTKVKYFKAFINDCVVPPQTSVKTVLRDNDEIEFRLENEARDQWLISNPAPTSKRKRSTDDVDEVLRESATDDVDEALREIATSKETSSFKIQFGNKRGRPIPPRPQVMACSVKSSISFVPRQVKKPNN